MTQATAPWETHPQEWAAFVKFTTFRDVTVRDLYDVYDSWRESWDYFKGGCANSAQVAHAGTTEKPVTPGLYLFKCSETEYKWEHAAVSEQNGTLVVHEEGLGTTHLDAFHDGLIDLEWHRIA